MHCGWIYIGIRLSTKKLKTILFRPDISFMLCFAYSFSCFHLQSYRIRFRLSRLFDRIKVMRYAVSILFALCEPFFSHTQMKSRAKKRNEFKSKRPNADEIRACDKYLMVECDEKSNKNCRHFSPEMFGSFGWIDEIECLILDLISQFQFQFQFQFEFNINKMCIAKY